MVMECYGVGDFWRLSGTLSTPHQSKTLSRHFGPSGSGDKCLLTLSMGGGGQLLKGGVYL